MAEFISKDDHHSQALTTPEQQLPKQLYLIPTPSRPFFPGQLQPILVNTDPWGTTLKAIIDKDQMIFGLIYSADDEQNKSSHQHFAYTGCAVRMMNPVQDDKHVQIVAKGLSRFHVTKWLSEAPPYLVEVTYPRESKDESDELKAYGMSIINAIKELVALNPLYGEELKQYFKYFNPSAPSPLTDFAAAITTAKGEDLQKVLDTVDLIPRMQLVLPLITREIEVAKLQHEITDEVNEQVNKHQREFFLKEQIKVIQKELGISKDDRQADIDRFNERIIGKTLSTEASEKMQEEMDKLAILETGSPEYAVTRNYLDWLTLLPWGISVQSHIDLIKAREILDADHDALDDVKDRIIEFLAVGHYKGEVAGSIILLVGPPGVGKTSIGKSIARALNRPFYRFSVGGMRDEAEIKGHRRTYIGALPGKLIQALKEVKVDNPVIMLDEVDKIGNSYHGDPASALLEVLDPEQNSQFVDHFMDVKVDLSNVLFLCTANQLDTIPPALLDRMDSIRLSGYILEEKLAIAKKHLIPKNLIDLNLSKSQFKFQDSAIKAMIENYAREAGVRKLEKQIQKVIRKVLVKEFDNFKKVSIKSQDLEEYLGQPHFKNEQTLTGIGVVTGLAWTALGGVTLSIEATAVPSRHKGFKQTGQLGNVMRESSEIAYSYIASNSEKLGVNLDFLEHHVIHLHVPEGATPKDGPSAGITMASALTSLLLNKKVKKSLAMSGELTLTGKVLPVGGIREKVIAAKRQKIKHLILPEVNQADYSELPDYIKRGLKIDFVSSYDEVFALIF
jgi:ATP-dependent Lon protease